MNNKDFLNILDELKSDIGHKKLFILSGHDLIATLENRFDTDGETYTKEECINLFDFIERKLEMPWSEYIDITIDNYNYNKKKQLK